MGLLRSTTLPDPTPTSESDVRRGRAQKTGLLLLLLVLLGATLCWARNRDILSELYDYSSMIAAAGKVEAGLRPYADFRSTMQSASYVLESLVEIIAGRSYLGLTWGGLALSLAGAFTIFGLLWRRFGAVFAALIAGAFTWAGFAQHVIIFYNPVGLLCLAVVCFGLIEIPGPRAWKVPRTWLVLAALVLGGANKINFQALALGLATLLILRAAVAGEITWRRLGLWWAALLGFGVAAPFGLELWWTGATLHQWYFNVVELAHGRVKLLPQVLSLHPYLVPAHPLYKHVLFRPLPAAGLIALILITIAAWRRIPALIAVQSRPVWRAWGLRGILLALALAAVGGGVLLTITNIEIITLTSLGVVVGVVMLAGSFGIARSRSVRAILLAACGLWMVVGGYAAWVGARVLFGRESLDRSTYVRLTHPPPELAYLKGVRLDANLYHSLMLTADELDKIRQARGTLSHVWFAQGMEWLERDSPDTIMRGMPVWYEVGASLRPHDGPWLRAHLAAKDTDRIFVNPSWENWPPRFRNWLHASFRAVNLGGYARLYERRNDVRVPSVPATFSEQEPLALIERTDSQIHLRATRTEARHEVGFHGSPWGDFYGTNGGWTWFWPQPSRIVEGTLVAEARQASDHPVEVRWRIIASPKQNKQVLWSGQYQLTASSGPMRAPFRVAPNGRPLAFEIIAGDGVIAGWRQMRIEDVDLGGQVSTEPPPGLILPTAAETLKTPEGATAWRRLPPGWNTPPVGGWQATPFEVWMPDLSNAPSWQATLAIKPAHQANGVTPIIMLLWYKAGRLGLQTQMAPPVTEGTFTIQGRLPDTGGVIGIVVRPASAGQPLNAELRIVRWPALGATP